MLKRGGCKIQRGSILQLQHEICHRSQGKQPGHSVRLDLTRHPHHSQEDQQRKCIPQHHQRKHMDMAGDAVHRPDNEILEDQLVAVVLTVQDNR
jgi:hypothetical protein